MATKTKEKILISAKKLIGKKGYNNTKVIDITKDAGIAKGSFYTYFETKEDVFVELLEKMFEKFHEKFDDIEYSGSFEKDIAKFIENVYWSATIDKTGIKIMTGMFMSAELSERIICIRNKFMRGTEAHLKRLFEKNIDSLTPEVISKRQYLAPAIEKMIRVYVMTTVLIDTDCGAFGMGGELPKEEQDMHKDFLAGIIYKALKK